MFGVSDLGLTVEQRDRTVIVPFRAILMVAILQVGYGSRASGNT